MLIKKFLIAVFMHRCDIARIPVAPFTNMV